ncbi:PAS domain-containing protein (plasmid) [Lichenicola cladoniae]|uniref:histidine kinase n=1 Tax=Lichenicola cladoniae TaxID=1484109 RepID=A0A6M8HXJ0_9PROT|nr:ATP-binding protein [Lichenicola cladoniae]NPD68963.1 PAS domain-containing protein [Acetobacteraceae bacterium]QKE93243.1 PAS domain-containing protein [Lichenicola cladoniae]
MPTFLPFRIGTMPGRLSGAARTWLLLACATVLPLLLFGGWVGYRSALQTRDSIQHRAIATVDAASDRIAAELDHHKALLRALAGSVALDRPDLAAFRATAERVRSQQPLWETVELTAPSGAQLLNLLRPSSANLGPKADMTSLRRMMRTGQLVVGGMGPVGAVSGRRLVSLQTPVIRNGRLQSVLSVEMAPDAIGTLLHRAGAPGAWIGMVVDASGRIVARTRPSGEDQGQLTSTTLQTAIAAAPNGLIRGKTLEGIPVQTVYRTLAGSDGWVVAFGIPLELLEAPVRRALLLLAVQGCLGLLLAGFLTSLVTFDLAERRREDAERTARLLRAVEESRALAVEAAELGVWRWQRGAGLFDASSRCWSLLGRTPSEDGRTSPRHAWNAVHPADRPALAAAIRRSLAGGGTLDEAVRIGHGDPPSRWIRITGRLLSRSDDEDGVLQGVIADISQIKRQEAERRALLRGMAGVQEDERRRIARELHDQVGQTVTGLSLGLKTLETMLSGPGADHAVVQDRLAWLRGLVASIDQDIHRAAADLRPATLDDFGLLPAIGALTDRWRDRHAIVVDVQTVGVVDRLPQEIETVVYRVVQEALSNVLKHARASTVSVLLERRDADVRLIVEDDGVGFVPDAGSTDQRPHLGLSGMRERLELVGGRLDVESTPSAGTTLYVSVPHGTTRLDAAA